MLAPGTDNSDLAVATLVRALRDAGLSDLVAAAEAAGDDPAIRLDALLAAIERLPDPLLVVVDDAHRASGTAVGVLARLAHELPTGHRLVLAARELPEGLVAPPGAVRLHAAELALSGEETAELAAAFLRRQPSDGEVEQVRRTSGSWPAAAVLAAARLATAGSPPSLAARPLEELLAELVGARALDDAVALATLPLIDDELAALAVGDGALERLAAAGLPLQDAGGPWRVLPDALRDALRSRGGLRPSRVEPVAERYAERGELRAAIEVLRATGQAEVLARLLSARSRAELATLDLAELRTTLDLLPDVVLAAHPRALLEAARIAADLTGERHRAELVQRLVALPPADGPAARAAAAEDALLLARRGEDEAAERVARAILGACGGGELVTRGRALLALGQALAFRNEPDAMAEAEQRLREAAAAFDAAGERAWRAAALTSLGYRVLFARGDLERAAEVLEAAAAGTPRGRERADLAGCVAEVHLHLGHLDAAEASARESLGAGRALGDHRLVGYGFWMLAAAASLRGDRAATLEALNAVDAHRGDWYDHPTGIEFLADAATMLARLGDPAARRYATVAQARPTPPATRRSRGSRWAPWRPARGTRRGPRSCSWPMPPRRSSRRAMPGGRCWCAPTPPAGAETGGRRALGPGDGRGRRARPSRPAAAAGADLVRRDGETTAYTLTLLGGFRVVAGGRELEVPPGRPATLVKVCALAGGSVPADVALEALWPDIDPATGKSRLRNLLNRVRAAVGPLVERDGEALRLAPGTSVDAAAFERAALDALAAPERDRAGLALAAIARYAGELLPTDRYAAWAAAPRERLQQRFLELVDVLAADAQERGDLDEAVRLLERGIATEGLDEGRYLTAAELLLRQGRRGAARALVERASAVREDLALPPSPRLERLRAATVPRMSAG